MRTCGRPATDIQPELGKANRSDRLLESNKAVLEGPGVDDDPHIKKG